MYESRKPAAHAGVSLLSLTLSLTLAAPVLAASAATKTAATASKHKTTNAKKQKLQLTKKAPTASTAGAGDTPAARPTPVVAVSQPTLQPAVAAPAQALPAVAAAVTPAAVIAVPTVAPAPVAAPAAPAAQMVNPYLAGWYRPIPAAALPAVAVAQLNYSARYVSDSVTSIPGKLADALPSIKTVHPTVGRDLVVANLKCPVEMVTGQYMLPANAMREGVNGLFSRLNDTQLLKFDIQLVCS